MRRFTVVFSGIVIALAAESARAETPRVETKADASAPTASEGALPTEYPPPSARGAVALTGAALAAAWYGAALGASFLYPDAPGATDLRIPVVGPWIALGETGCPSDEPNCSTASVVVRAILIAVDGIGQLGGLAMLAEGLFLPTAPPGTERAASASFRPVLVTRHDGVGLGLTGTF
ncbi:MAG: hypothetical protein DIU78_018440 [Pseudomonadota bacterium]